VPPGLCLQYSTHGRGQVKSNYVVKDTYNLTGLLLFHGLDLTRKVEERKEPTMNVQYYDELNGYYSEELADILEDFEG